jgi:hypothetical protein
MVINGPGLWQHNTSGEILEVYELEPAGNVLCVWWKDVGQPVDTTDFWSSDEWLGHIPVHLYTTIEGRDNLNWVKITS